MSRENLGVAESPLLLDRKRVEAEYGLRRADLDRAFRHLEVVQLPGARKTYVRRPDLEAYIDANTFDGRTRVPPAA
jgi:hypothetical protein